VSDATSGPSSRLAFGDFVFDRASRRLLCDGVERHLPPRVFDLLDYLLARPDQVVSKRELLEQVWAGRPLTDGVLTQAMAELRRALDDGDEGPSRIATVHRVGYRLIGPVRGLAADEVDALPPAPAVLDASAAAGPSPAPTRRAKPGRFAKLALSLVLVSVLVSLLVAIALLWRREVAPEPLRLGLAPVQLAPGLALEAGPIDAALWERLRRQPGLEVVRLAGDPARNGGAAGARALIAELRLATLLRPTLRRHGDALLLQLAFEPRAGGEAARVALRVEAAPEAIARRAVAAVARQFGLAVPVEPAAAAADSERHRLRGEAQLAQRQRAAAIVSFEQALRHDGQNAAAHGSLAVALAATAGQTLPQDEAQARARRHANQALQLQPDTASAHAALGLIALSEGAGQAPEALARFDHALALDPGYSDAWMWRSLLDHPALSLHSRIHDLERVLALDPGHRVARGNLALTYLLADRVDEAQRLLAPAGSDAEEPQLVAPRVALAESRGRPDESLALQLRAYPEASTTPQLRFRLAALIQLDDLVLVRALLDRLLQRAQAEPLEAARLVTPLVELCDGARLQSLLAARAPGDAVRVLGPGTGLREGAGVAAALAGDWPAAIAALAPGIDRPGGLAPRGGAIGESVNLALWLAHARAGAGAAEAARTLRRRVADFIAAQRQGGYGDNQQLIFAEARLAALDGDAERAFELLQRALAAGALRSENLRRDPRWDALRPDPRFAALLRRMEAGAAAARLRLEASPQGEAWRRWRAGMLAAPPG
jgi:DNA-binding winged helix-turn-helix (wHTH) protein/Flp pilus assembly protein TadD